MEKVLSCHDVAEIDRTVVTKIGVPEAVLIENAAREFIGILSVSKSSIIQIICGKGNNGADGYAIGRHLVNDGYSAVTCIQVSKELGAQCLFERNLAVSYGVRVVSIDDFIRGKGLVIDALYGTGFHPPMDEDGMAVIRMLSGHPNVISVDVPSGLSDQTPLDSLSVQARFTVTFGAMKSCLLSPYASRRVSDGTVPAVRNPGFPRKLIDDACGDFQLIEQEDASLETLDPTAYKNQRGHVAFFGGCESQCGAAILSGLSAFNARAGLVTILLSPNSQRFFDYPQLMMGKYSDDLSLFDAIGLGNGLDINDADAPSLVQRVLEADRPTVLDSGALRVLDKVKFPERTAPLVMTPHLGELKSVLQCDNLKLLSTVEYLALLRRKAAEYGAVIVAKSNVTWVVGPEGRVNALWGNLSQLGVAGSGDVLCGIIAAFLAQGMSAFDAAVNGVLVHFHAGKAAKAQNGWFDSLLLTSLVGKAVDDLSEDSR